MGPGYHAPILLDWILNSRRIYPSACRFLVVSERAMQGADLPAMCVAGTYDGGVAGWEQHMKDGKKTFKLVSLNGGALAAGRSRTAYGVWKKNFKMVGLASLPGYDGSTWRMGGRLSD